MSHPSDRVDGARGNTSIACRRAARRAALVGALLVIVAARGASALDAPLRWQVDTWDRSSAVLSIAESPDGHLWLATGTGLQRFDGINFTTFDRKSTPALPEDLVKRVLVTRAGVMWVGLGTMGLLRWTDRRFDRFTSADGLGGDEVQCMVEDDAGDLWVGTRTGLSRLRVADRDHFTTLRKADGLLDDDVRGLFVDAGGRVVIETASGLHRFANDRLTGEPLAGPGERRRSAQILGALLPPGSPAAEALGFEEIPLVVRGLRVDRAGHLWVGTLEGLFHIAAGKVQRFGAEQGLTGDGVLSLFEDRRGQIWVATHGGGVSRIAPPRARTLGRLEGLGADFPFSIAEAPDGAIWMTTNVGMARWANGKLDTFVPDPKVAGVRSLRALAIDRDGVLWMTSYGGRLVVIRNGAASIVPREAMPPGVPSALAVDQEGRLWLGTSTGQLGIWTGAVFRETAARPIPCPVSPCPGRVFRILPRRAGGVWIVTASAGVYAHDGEEGGQGHPIRLAGPPEGEPVRSAFEGADGVVWVATARGLWRVAGASAFRFGTEHGLAEERITEILEDGAGGLWLGGPRGLSRVSRDDLAAVAAGRQGRVGVRVFDRRDGVRGEDVIGGDMPASLRARDGRLWFATLRGAVIVEAPERWPRDITPGAVIERVVLDGTPRSPETGAIEIPPGGRTLEIHSVAPTTAFAHQVRFRHQLEGRDRAWIEAGEESRVSYTDLPPGAYTFRVVASLGGVASAPAVLRIQVRPPFHRSLPFYAIVAVAAAASAFGLQRLRVRQVEARFSAVLNERARIAHELHDTLAQVFSAIGFQMDRMSGALSRPEAATTVAEHLRRARQMLSHGRVASRQVVLGLRSRAETLAATLEELPRLYEGAFFAVSVEGAPRTLSPAVETELVRVAQEAVSNAIAHGHAEHISISLEYTERGLALWVRDDGGGFERGGGEVAQADLGHGHGLPGMRERARRLGGRLEITSLPGVGTEVGVVIDDLPTWRKDAVS